MYIASRRTIITFLLLIVTISFKIKFKLKSIYLIEMTIILQTAYNNDALHWVCTCILNFVEPFNAIPAGVSYVYLYLYHDLTPC